MTQGDRRLHCEPRRPRGTLPSRFAVALAVGVAAHAVPAAASDFYTLTPCRLVDTRLADGPLAGPALEANTSRTSVVPGHCGIPLAAIALSANVAIAAPTATGHLKLHASRRAPRRSTTSRARPGPTTRSRPWVRMEASWST